MSATLSSEQIILVTILLLLAIIGISTVSYANSNFSYATFAGGCFWCMEAAFEEVDGVVEVISGFTGGEVANLSYKEVAAGKTKHVEAVKVKYDPKQVSYAELLALYWQQINPTDRGGQFVDRGKQYTTAIFYHNQWQKELAQQSKKILDDANVFSWDIVTKIKAAQEFYPAEEKHQDYYKKHPISYKFYSIRSGRKKYLKKTWTEAKLKYLEEISQLDLDKN